MRDTKQPLAEWAVLAVAVAALVGTAACSGPEDVAMQLFEQGTALIKEGDDAGGVALMQRILEEYPDTRVAQQVRDDWSYYEELLVIARERLPRIAADDLRRIGRALESYRDRRGGYPETLAALVPRDLDALPSDPWGRSYLYRRDGRGYVAETLGRDGERGGEQQDRDVRLVHGILQNAPRGGRMR